MTPKSDYELAQAVSHGAVSSIGDLYERHSQRVYTICLRMTGDVADAEDLTQDVFIQLLQKAGSFRGESQFKTWLYRVTVNQVLMHFRRSVRRQRVAEYAGGAGDDAGCETLFQSAGHRSARFKGGRGETTFGLSFRLSQI